MIHAEIAHLAHPIADLAPYPLNPRIGNVEAIAESLRVNGQYRPVVANRRTNQILAGNHTWKAAGMLGWPEVAVTWVDVDETDAARIVAVDNRANDLAGYDNAALVELLSAMPDLEGSLYTGEDLTQLVAGLNTEVSVTLTEDESAESVPILVGPPVTTAGDVWLLGRHRVICGDCRDHETVSRVLNGDSVNIAFTSPPYASQRAYDESSGFKPIRPDEYLDWFADVQANIRAHLAADGSWFVNVKEHGEDGQRSLYVKDLTIAHVRKWAWRFVDELCWVDTRNGVPGHWPNKFKDAWEPVFHFTGGAAIKFHPLANGLPSNNVFTYSPENSSAGTGSGLLGSNKGSGMGEGLARPSNVLHIAAAASAGLDHSAPFPVDLPAWFIRAYSDPGDVVLDPFLGSGTTLIAAHRESRICRGVEISPRYVDAICRRYQQLTGDKPIHEGTGAPVDFCVEGASHGPPDGPTTETP